MSLVDMQYTVYTDALRQALCRDVQTLPRLTMDGSRMKVTHFFDDTAGMCLISIPIHKASTLTKVSFEITPTMQGFIKHCTSFDKMTFNVKNGALSLLVQNPCCALRYDFPILNMIDDVSIEHTTDETVIEIPTNDWLEIWKTIPNDDEKSQVTISHRKGEKAITLKHSKDSWAAVIQLQQSPVTYPSLSFTCPVSTAKLSFADCLSKDTTSFLHFLKNTVLCWSSSNTCVYLAPSVVDKS
jgi:hypothetical protein